MPEGKGSLWHSVSWSSIAFGVTLALIIGLRLDRAALTVIVGVACGILASLPTGFLVVALSKRRNEQQEKHRRSMAMTQPPPVVVVAPPMMPVTRQQNGWDGQLALPVPAQRQFAIIGEEKIENL